MAATTPNPGPYNLGPFQEIVAIGWGGAEPPIDPDWTGIVDFDAELPNTQQRTYLGGGPLPGICGSVTQETDASFPTLTIAYTQFTIDYTGTPPTPGLQTWQQMQFEGVTSGATWTLFQNPDFDYFVCYTADITDVFASTSGISYPPAGGDEILRDRYTVCREIDANTWQINLYYHPGAAKGFQAGETLQIRNLNP